jgi:aminoglycoside phosphotransferase
MNVAPDPILADVKAARMLPGLSGAQVYLVTQDGRHWFVRKAALERGGSERLKRQALKQRSFGALAKGSFSVPRIMSDGEREGRYWFDMEFVRGVDGATFLRRATFPQITAFADQLCAYIELAAGAAPVDSSRTASLFDALYSRICAVKEKVPSLDNATLGSLLRALNDVRAHASQQPTLCHGDLTLENLVIDEKGQVYALDLLDAPFEHYWQDVAKLHQDLAGGWYLRKQLPIALGVLQYVSRRLVDIATKLDPHYPNVHAVLVASTFVRILPYATDVDERRFVQERVTHFVAQCNSREERR